jgi:hypothetical protein
MKRPCQGKERPGVPHPAGHRRGPGSAGAGGGPAFRADVADCGYGDQDGFRAELAGAGLPFVMALRPRRGPGQ